MIAYRHIVLAFAAGLGSTLGLIACVLATGSTFGQRCERALPDRPASQEQCVWKLSHGLRVLP